MGGERNRAQHTQRKNFISYTKKFFNVPEKSLVMYQEVPTSPYRKVS